MGGRGCDISQHCSPTVHNWVCMLSRSPRSSMASSRNTPSSSSTEVLQFLLLLMVSTQLVAHSCLGGVGVGSSVSIRYSDSIPLIMFWTHSLSAVAMVGEINTSSVAIFLLKIVGLQRVQSTVAAFGSNSLWHGPFWISFVKQNLKIIKGNLIIIAIKWMMQN